MKSQACDSSDFIELIEFSYFFVARDAFNCINSMDPLGADFVYDRLHYVIVRIIFCAFIRALERSIPELSTDRSHSVQLLISFLSY